MNRTLKKWGLVAIALVIGVMGADYIRKQFPWIDKNNPFKQP